MWILYGLAIFMVPLLQSVFHFSEFVFMIMMCGIFVGGLMLMMLYWQHLHEHYTHH